MKATGIVRRIDDLGRIVIPKEIRRSFRIKEGDPLEIYTEADGEVIFKKYSPIGELSAFAGQYAEVLNKNGGCPVAITDNEHVVAASGISKREVMDRRVSKEVEDIMDRRAVMIATKDVTPIPAIEGYDRRASVVYPIVYGGDVSGSVILIEAEAGALPNETQVKLVQVAAAFLGKQMNMQLALFFPYFSIYCTALKRQVQWGDLRIAAFQPFQDSCQYRLYDGRYLQ